MNHRRGTGEGGGAGGKRPATVMIVDDHPIVRTGIARFLNADAGLTVGAEASSEGEAMTLMEEVNPDIVLVDIALDGSNGIDLIRSIRKRFGPVPMLALSMHEEDLYAERAIRAGARGYIMKSARPDELLRAVRTVLSGGVYLSPQIAGQLVDELNGEGRKGKKTGVESLSDRELAIFERLGHGKSTRAIATELHISMKTVQTHYAHMKRKLAAQDVAELMQRAVSWVGGPPTRRRAR